MAWAAARPACPIEPRPSVTSPSALACSLEMRLVRSLWENTFSWASEAFLFKSYVLCHAFRASTQIASWVARRLQISLKALLVFAIAAWRSPWQRWPCLRRRNPVRPADGPGPFGFEVVSNLCGYCIYLPPRVQTSPFSWRPRRQCTPPPERLEHVSSSGSCRKPVRFCVVFVGGAEAIFSVIQQTMASNL